MEVTVDKCILYIGGFILPDKNAAAQRVIGVAKGLRDLGYKIVFLNAIKNHDKPNVVKKTYFGFECYEYKREKDADYLFRGDRVLHFIEIIKPDIVLAYNYPSLPLNRLRRYGKKHGFKCYADVTEWYVAAEKRIIYDFIKNIDSTFRMKYVHKRMDGVIAISRYLFDYYRNAVRTVLIPPTVDITDFKWKELKKTTDKISLVYAGLPSAQKERLDIIVKSIEDISKNTQVELNIVGITKEQFINIYKWEKELSDRIVFWGRIDHEEALDIVKKANWSIIFRENNKVVQAGFPTKLVESISCGTPVVVNKFSNIEDYLDESNSLILCNTDTLGDTLPKISGVNSEHNSLKNNIFDYRNYLNELKELVEDEGI